MPIGESINIQDSCEDEFRLTVGSMADDKQSSLQALQLIAQPCHLLDCSFLVLQYSSLGSCNLHQLLPPFDCF
jgi:hypothetical protein